MSATMATTAEPILVGGTNVWRDDVVAVRNPYNGEIVGEVCYASPEDAEAALFAADHALATTRKLPSWKRAEILTKIADALSARTEEFARLISAEVGKPMREARGEVGRAVVTFRVSAEEAKRIDGKVTPADWTPGTDGRMALSRRFPIGTVLGITPFNFPLNLAAHKLGPAIASGCPVVIKPAPQTPLVSLLLGRLIVEAGWPAGAISMLPCSNEVAAAMVADDRVKMLSFTGSAPIGWMLKEAAPRKRVTLELGGNAAVIVCEDADIALAAEKILAGGFANAGQSCISVQRVYAHRSVRERLLETLSRGVKALTPGNPFDDETRLGPMVHEAAAKRAESWVREAVSAGATLHAGGSREGALLAATLLSEVPETATLCREEAFAPIVLVNAFDSFDEAIARVNASEYGLHAAIFTKNWQTMTQAWNELEVGAVLVDEPSSWRADHLPYGGVKNSGVGKEGVRAAIEEMTEERMLIVAV